MSTLNIRRFGRKAESTAVMLLRLNIRRFWVFHYIVSYYKMENPNTADIQPFKHNGGRFSLPIKTADIQG